MASHSAPQTIREVLADTRTWAVVLGERCYRSVTAIPAGEGVEVVEIFRRADCAGDRCPAIELPRLAA